MLLLFDILKNRLCLRHSATTFKAMICRFSSPLCAPHLPSSNVMLVLQEHVGWQQQLHSFSRSEAAVVQKLNRTQQRFSKRAKQLWSFNSLQRDGLWWHTTLLCQTQWYNILIIMCCSLLDGVPSVPLFCHYQLYKLKDNIFLSSVLESRLLANFPW